MTPGQELTAELRRYFTVGTRTRRYRKDGYLFDLHVEMVEAVKIAATQRGYYTERTEKPLRLGFGAALAYDKHVGGDRVPRTVAQQVHARTAWQFAGLLGQMVDAGVTNTGEGERFFAEMARAA